VDIYISTSYIIGCRSKDFSPSPVILRCRTNVSVLVTSTSNFFSKGLLPSQDIWRYLNAVKYTCLHHVNPCKYEIIRTYKLSLNSKKHISYLTGPSWNTFTPTLILLLSCSPYQLILPFPVLSSFHSRVRQPLCQSDFMTLPLALLREQTVMILSLERA
jgi:hypothetical protein